MTRSRDNVRDNAAEIVRFRRQAQHDTGACDVVRSGENRKDVVGKLACVSGKQTFSGHTDRYEGSIKAAYPGLAYSGDVADCAGIGLSDRFSGGKREDVSFLPVWPVDGMPVLSMRFYGPGKARMVNMTKNCRSVPDIGVHLATVRHGKTSAGNADPA